MKKILFMFLIASLLLISSCGKSKKEQAGSSSEREGDFYIAADYELIDYSFEDLCKNSDVCVLAEYEDILQNDNYTEFKFKVKEVICGQIEDEELYLFTVPGNVKVEGTNHIFDSGGKKYELGKEYVLILERFQMLFYDHDRYQQAADLLVIPSEGKYMLNGKMLNYEDKDALEKDILSFYSETSHDPLPQKKSYTSAEEQMEAESDVIATVKINKLISQGIYHNGNNYSCTIEKFEKNNCSWIREGMEVEIVLERGVVEEGKSYRIGFVPADKNSESMIFIQAVMGTIKQLGHIKN